ncbi:hypothetical protein HPHPP28B_1226 [Helicobacter pylori Hp P-28b]|nr:hypothetical protein HPHPP28B_1226 [Helicobacter pylori Hp P-28b]EJC54201.1 hypothetical protein HPHPP62_1239 [Helicobacter pylori Hp P-62]
MTRIERKINFIGKLKMKKDSKGIKRENKPTQKVFLIQRRKNLDSI